MKGCRQRSQANGGWLAGSSARNSLRSCFLLRRMNVRTILARAIRRPVIPSLSRRLLAARSSFRCVIRRVWSQTTKVHAKLLSGTPHNVPRGRAGGVGTLHKVAKAHVPMETHLFAQQAKSAPEPRCEALWPARKHGFRVKIVLKLVVVPPPCPVLLVVYGAVSIRIQLPHEFLHLSKQKKKRKETKHLDAPTGAARTGLA